MWNLITKTKKLNDYLYVENAKLIEKKAALLTSEYKKKLLGHELVECSLMSEMIVDLVRVDHMLSLAKNGVTRSILEYIDEYYAESLTNRSIAVKFGFHPNYLSTLVKKAVGMPLYRYLLHIRLSHAAELLESESYSVKEISNGGFL